jgi:hypothetical protein
MSRPQHTAAAVRPGSSSRSRWLLGAALVATLLAAFWPAAEPVDEADGLRPLQRGAAQPGAPAAMAMASASVPVAGSLSAMGNTLPDRRPYADAAVLHDPFAAPTVAVAASAPVPVAPAPVAAAPPQPALPWQFGGRLQVPEQADAVLLNDSTRTHTLAVGQSLDGWRLDADRGSSLDFTHLASGHRQSLVLTP